MVDLSTNYMGFKLATPLVASSSPLCKDVATVERLAAAGVGAIVLHSLFEEQIDAEATALDRALSAGVATAEAQDYFPDLTSYNVGPDGYLEHIAKVKAAVRTPVIASLNGTTLGGWLRYARLMQDAGADGIELNLYDIPTDPELPGSVVEQRYVDIVTDIRAKVTIPLAVKIGPYFSSIADMARRLSEAGANGLVIFNRFYQPDYDLDALDVVPALELSTPSELRLRLHWAALLYGNVTADIAITGGVYNAEHVVKSMMAGAKVAMTTSALLSNGIPHAAKVINDLHNWLVEHEYESITQMQGAMSAKKVADPSAFERGNYMRVLGSYTLAQAAK